MSETRIHPKKAGRRGRPQKTKSNDNNGDTVNSGNVQAEEAKEQKPSLQRTPLQEKLEEIISKCGLKSFDTDVEKCLYWCLEVRMSGLIRNLIGVSKQHADSEKSRSSVAVSSDVRKQILQVNKMFGAESEKQPAEEDELTKLIEVRKEKDYRILMKKAANLVVRAAVGGDDKVSKWQAMVEEAKQKHATAFNHDKKVQKSEVTRPGNRKISVKDVISVLEREPQMAKSLLLYNLYERVGAKATVNNIPQDK